MSATEKIQPSNNPSYSPSTLNIKMGVGTCIDTGP